MLFDRIYKQPDFCQISFAIEKKGDYCTKTNASININMI